MTFSILFWFWGNFGVWAFCCFMGGFLLFFVVVFFSPPKANKNTKTKQKNFTQNKLQTKKKIKQNKL